MSSFAPIRRSLIVPLSVEGAFELFFRRLPEWWPLATRSVGLANAASCHVEVHLGGRLFERSTEGVESTWGTFRALDEPRRAVIGWHPGHDESFATEVEVTFESEAGGTRVSLEHRGWEKLGERASFVRALFEGGWSPVLARYEALARGRAELPPVLGPGCVESAGGGDAGSTS